MSGDTLQRLVFEQANVRGIHVSLDRVFREVLLRNDPPDAICTLLGEALVVVAMMSSGIKFTGRISLQVSAAGPLRLLMADCTEQGGLRAIARLDEDMPDTPDLQQLAPGGVLTLTVQPLDGGRQWQGIVPLTGSSLCTSVETYFSTSEQLDTRLVLGVSRHRAAGVLLQRLPGEAADDDGWSRLSHLLSTLAPEELLETDGETLLRRLFHAEDRRQFQPRALEYHCPCSRERVRSVLRSLGGEELAAMLDESEPIEVCCEFCGQGYSFDRLDVAQLLRSEEAPGVPPGTTAH